MGKVVAALQKADPRVVAPRARGGAAIEVDGYTLEADEVEVLALDKPGFAAAAEGSLTVAVTTEITPELALEGKARELVHRIQNMRKAAGFDIADRIELYFEGDDEVAEVFAVHGDYVRQEVLAQRIVRGPAPSGGYGESQKIDSVNVELGVVRAAT